jgi:hypothetical protein
VGVACWPGSDAAGVQERQHGWEQVFVDCGHGSHHDGRQHGYPVQVPRMWIDGLPPVAATTKIEG